MVEVAKTSTAAAPRAVVFTTNVDCALERAFIEAEAPFFRVVFDLDERRFHCTQFVAAERHGGNFILRGGVRSLSLILWMSCDPMNFGTMRHAIHKKLRTTPIVAHWSA